MRVGLELRLVTGFARELRGPLTSIVGAAELLGEHGLSAEDSGELRRMLQRNSESFHSLVARFLDAALIEAGQMTPALMALDARRVLERAVLDVREELGLPAGEIEVCVGGGSWEAVMLDGDRVRYVLGALMMAELQSARRGPLTIDASQESAGPGTCRLRVRVGGGRGEAWDGAGERRRLERPGGFHVAMARTLARALGGEVREEGVDGAHGVEMVLSARLAGADGGTDAGAPELEVADLTGVRVLLAEDGAAGQKLLATVLRRAGARVHLARNGAIAVDLARAAHEEGRDYDVILMDLRMPVLDGFQATRRLRALGVRSPVVAVSAGAQAEERAACVEAGMNDFISKPPARSLLLRTVRSWADRTGASRAA